MKSVTKERFIREWVKDLESGKYEQGEGSLQVGHTYCCLGVAECTARRLGCVDADTVERELKLKSVPGHWFGRLIGKGEDDEDINNPDLLIPPRLRTSADGSSKVEATELNDQFNFTFRQIAACIRCTWPKAFRRGRPRP